MNSMPTTKRSLRKAKSCLPDLFAWSRKTELLAHPPVRVITRRANVSPALALVFAELSGLMRETRHD
jgi:hypothetical protein